MNERTSEQINERATRRDGVRIVVVVAVIDYLEKIIKRSRSRRAKKSHRTAGGQRDTAEAHRCVFVKILLNLGKPLLRVKGTLEIQM